MYRLEKRKKQIRNLLKNNYLLKLHSLSDYLLESLHLSKIINNIMKHGKKDIAEKKIYYVLKKLKQILNKNPEFYMYNLHIKMLPFLKIQLMSM